MSVWTEPWAGSHIPLLAGTIASARPGRVLEIGGGPCSTPLIAELCAVMGREFRSLENSAEWVAELAERFPGRVGHMPDWSAIGDVVRGEDFAVIFIDCSPGSARLPILRACRGRAEFIVLHDTCDPAADVEGDQLGMQAELDTFPWRHDYKLMRPCTTVVSDVRKYPGAP